MRAIKRLDNLIIMKYIKLKPGSFINNRLKKLIFLSIENVSRRNVYYFFLYLLKIGFFNLR